MEILDNFYLCKSIQKEEGKQQATMQLLGGIPTFRKIPAVQDFDICVCVCVYSYIQPL